MKPAGLVWTLVLLGAAAGSLRADLAAARAEPKLEKRAQLALDNADRALKIAQDAYLEKNDQQAMESGIAEVLASVELACESLQKTGKNASKSPKHFKNAEIRTRELLRRMRDFREQTSVMDRDELDKVSAGIQKLHDELLAGIMGEKRKK